MELYFIRHGETIWNVEQRFQGSLDSPLTEKGILQAKLLSKHLRNINFTQFYSSPAKRATDTANILLGDRIQSLDIMEEFAEINIGDMEGVKSSIFKEKYPELFHNFFFDPDNYDPSIINGESFLQLEERVKVGLKKLVDSHSPNDRILMVSHGGTLRTLFNIIDSDKNKTFLKIIANTSVSIVSYSDNNFNFLSFSDTKHLEGNSYD